MENLVPPAQPPKIAEAVSFAADIMAAGVSYGLNLASAILLLIGGYLLARYVSRTIRDRLTRAGRFDRTLIPVFAQLAHYTILAITIILVLAKFGVQTTSLIAVLGAAGLAIGLALQGTLQNVAAGIMLLIIRPFEVGHYIQSENYAGTVNEIGLFVTRLTTFDGIFVAVPNSKLWSNAVTNYSKLPTRRLDLPIGISYDDDIDKAVSVLTGLIKADGRTLGDPAAKVVVKDFGESSVDLEARAWVRREDFWDYRFDLIRAAKYVFDWEGITIPYPHRQIISQPVASGKSPRQAA